MAREVVPFLFQPGVTVAQIGQSFSPAHLRTLVVEVVFNGGATGTVNFQGAGPSGVFYSLMGVNLTTNAAATSATASGLWQFDITGVETVRFPVASAAGGSITVQGKAVA